MTHRPPWPFPVTALGARSPLPLTAPLGDDQDELLGAIDAAWTPPARR